MIPSDRRAPRSWISPPSGSIIIDKQSITSQRNPEAVIQRSRWSLKIPWSVWAVRGSCAEIPCPFDHPSKSSNPQIRWLKGASVVYDSAHPGGAGAEYGGRTGLKGNLSERQCSLLIKNISSRDEGEYHIRVRITTERGSSVEYSSQIVVSLCIREKLRISAPGQLIVGKPANLTCSLRFFKLSCLESNLKLNWAQDAGSPPNLSDAETAQKIRRNFAGSWTVSSTFILTPSLDHQEKTLTCEFIGADGWRIAQEAVRLEEVQGALGNPVTNSSIGTVEGSSLLGCCAATGDLTGQFNIDPTGGSDQQFFDRGTEVVHS
ncbi:myeloid cell surface antigen CD33-like [Cetorhinus maximus]